MDGFYCAARKDLGVGGWGPGNPYGVRIEKSVRIIGPSLILEFHHGFISKISSVTLLSIYVIITYTHLQITVSLFNAYMHKQITKEFEGRKYCTCMSEHLLGM